MDSWLRGVSLLGLAFGGVVVTTLGLAALLVPGTAGSAGGANPPSSSESAAPAGRVTGPVTAVGGALAVSGDREGVFMVDREQTDLGYALAGEDGQIYFARNPLAVERISYDGLEFYLDEGDCTITPGERHDPTGVAGAHVRCEQIEDIRDGGTITVEGTVGISADLLGLRGDLPPSGGTIRVGDEELRFPFALIYTGPTGPRTFVPGGGFLPSEDGRALLRFNYEPQTHAVNLVGVELLGSMTELDRGACTLTTEELGLLNPRTTTARLTVDCPAVTLASGETVPIRGTLVVDMAEPP